MAIESLINPLNELLEKGTCMISSKELNAMLEGLAHLCSNSEILVISQRLLIARQQLNNNQELMAAILATDNDIQSAWCQLMAARCREAGQLAEPQVLIRLLSQLDGSATWVASCLEQGNRVSSLQPTPFAKIERQLLGASAEQNQITLTLSRILAVASNLCQWQQQPLFEIGIVDKAGTRPDINWCRGRLIQQPGEQPREPQYLLSGAATQPLPTSPGQLNDKQQSLAIMKWVLTHPWAYLLTLILYEQNVWQVETAGGLILELPAGQSAQAPSEVQVLVVGKEGDELLCGSLGEFVIKILSSLDMAIFPAGVTEAELNAGLTRVIGQLLNLKVWRYVEGLSGVQGAYQIHPDFSDVCYGRKGQPSFSRYARHLRQAIRSQAVQWHNDRKSLVRMSSQIMDGSAA